ncbi:type II toxin-antitoxin system HicB family antitoxin [Kushneria aurantia]|uniref:Type II toxin-antitoxin system HicB family antitoxin n=1 Tax=Kushneria aurantia TaxID=504092 RepID=A0ABV6G5V0_9GAMM|nr:type II toxin-antitoxin system HicB family antitoxin [Kushneria aurantia]
MRYMVVLEEGATSWGARVPDIPGCVAVGDSREEALALIRDAIRFHLEGLEEEGEALPTPHSTSEFVDVTAAHY